MLELKNIKKTYVTGGLKQEALKGINVKFRENEFVSILGASGCGKTTLLNIIGGLDAYTSGDLIINGTSTKNYKDRDWDTYRNHSVGFVFQSYNLIPHQNVLSNVELSLTLSGVSKKERRERAIAVLEKVGLKDQMYKKPNQMSGGQMQRVAIARALVNDPDILLADEPTGALDSTTSVQIMDLLKEIAKDKLVIMVTHNPDLAEQYSTRIIRILDGLLISDSNPYEESSKKKKISSGKTYMSFKTALFLSLNNLLTKKGRTFLTSFAGSIGIIGIALILSLSSGVQNYIKKVEEETLSTYPITLEESSVDMGVMLEALSSVRKGSDNHYQDNQIHTNLLMNDLLSMLSTKMTSNNLHKFKEYLESDEELKSYINAIQYGYNLNIHLYNPNGVGGLVQVNPNQILSKLGFEEMMSMQNSTLGSSMMNENIFEELLDNQELLKKQYDLLEGRMPENFNEVVLIINANNEISDYTLYGLGLMDQDELARNFEALMKGEEVTSVEAKTYSYEELLNLSFKLLLNTDYYQKQNGIWIDKRENKDYMNSVLDNAVDIKVVGIMRPNEEAVSVSNLALTGGVGYLSSLKEYVIEEINKKEIVKEQKENPTINVFTGMEFNKQNGNFNINSLSTQQRNYLMSLSEVERAALITTYQEQMSATLNSNLELLGVVDIDSPSSINLYPIDFASKEAIAEMIEKYNENEKKNGHEENVISYSDLVGTMMSSVTSIIDIISYVLIAFVSVSLIVSSIMIGIITYISVLERTKEIGILRALGASKKDISRVFNAETFIVGLGAGIIGILCTLLINIPINLVLKKLLNISNIASLPWVGAIILILISMILTVIAGLIPSRMASKKDPVEALRTE